MFSTRKMTCLNSCYRRVAQRKVSNDVISPFITHARLRLTRIVCNCCAEKIAWHLWKGTFKKSIKIFGNMVAVNNTKVVKEQVGIRIHFLVGTMMMSLVKRVCLRLKIFSYLEMKFYFINLSQISTFAKYIFPNIYF